MKLMKYIAMFQTLGGCLMLWQEIVNDGSPFMVAYGLGAWLIILMMQYNMFED